MLAARKVHDDVRSDAPRITGQRALLVEVAALEHARQFDDPPQLHLAPASACGRRAKGFGQRVRRRAKRRHLRRQAREGLDAFAFGLAKARFHLREGVGHRPDECVDGGVASLKLCVRFLLKALE